MAALSTCMRKTLLESWALPLQTSSAERAEELQAVNKLLQFFRDDLRPYLDG